MAEGKGSKGLLGGREVGFGYGRQLVANPLMVQMPRLEVSQAQLLGLGNPMANTLLYAPGWYDFGGEDSGSIGARTDSNAPGSGPGGDRGTRVTCNANKLKGLCVPIPFIDSLAGRRVRFRCVVQGSSDSTGSARGVHAVLTGRLFRQSWGTPASPGEALGTTGDKDLAHMALTSGIGHLVAMHARAPLEINPNAFSIQDVGLASDNGRLTTFNRLYDSWQTDIGGGTSRISIDKFGGGANDHDEDHFVWFVDNDVQDGSDDVFPLYTGSISDDAVETIDVVVQMPDVGDDDFPVDDDSNVGWLVILPLSQDTSDGSGTNVVDFHSIQLDVLDDDANTPLASGLDGILGGGLDAAWWANFCLAYPVYTPTSYFLAGEAFSLSYGGTLSPDMGAFGSTPNGNVLVASLPVPSGSIVHTLSMSTGAMSLSPALLRLYQSNPNHLRGYDVSEGPSRLKLADIAIVLSDTTVAVPCNRNRMGSLTTGHSGESLLNVVPSGSDSIGFRLRPSTGTLYGVQVDLLVDRRLALGGGGIRA